MASLQERNGAFRIQFFQDGKLRSFSLGKVRQSEATHRKARTEELLSLLKRNLLQVPPGVSLADFLAHDGKPPVDPALSIRKETTLGQLTADYIATYSNGAIEANTLATAKIHLAHIEETLGRRFLLSAVTLARLQQHVDRRIKTVGPVTIRKEIATFGAAWNWAARGKLVAGKFPSAGLVYPKTDEKLPFMSWPEIQRRIRAGGDADELWEALYLNTEETAALLKHVKSQKAPAWVYPMIAVAAHTGARRSELIRARVEDIDLGEAVATIREKKRQQGTCTTRRVPLSKHLITVLKPWLAGRKNCVHLFSATGDRPLSVQAVQKAFVRVLADSKWEVVRGWHVLRHSFVSACASKGIDQRMLQAWVGHQTAEMARRYTHLFPSVQEAAIRSVFG
jgi:integrase